MTSFELEISEIERTVLPKVYRLRAVSEDKEVTMTFDLPEKLQDIMKFKTGERLELVISRDEIPDVTDEDLYMHGRLFVIKEEKGRKRLMISIGGLILKVEGPTERMPTDFRLFEELYVLLRRKK